MDPPCTSLALEIFYLQSLVTNTALLYKSIVYVAFSGILCVDQNASEALQTVADDPHMSYGRK